MKINEVFAINQKSRSGVGGALPDAYLDEASAVYMARSLADVGARADEVRELTVGDDEDDAIVFRITNGHDTFEVIRLNIAY